MRNPLEEGFASDSLVGEVTDAMISNWSERMINHTRPETLPILIQEAAVGIFLQ